MSKYESIEALARAVHELEKAASSAAGGPREDVADKCSATAVVLLGSIEDLIESTDSPTGDDGPTVDVVDTSDIPGLEHF